jgi:activating signal cointegrator 1
MKTLSLTQPWATLVAINAKRVETRSWGTSYRGQLAIHASKSFPKDCKELCGDDPFFTKLLAAGYGRREQGAPDDNWMEIDVERLPRGVIIATCFLTDCRRITESRSDIPVPDASVELAFGDYTPRRFAWVFAGITPITPVPAKGSLGLWNSSI